MKKTSGFTGKQKRAYEQHKRNAAEDITNFSQQECVDRAKEQDRLYKIAFG